MGIEPTSKAWEAFVLPLNHTRDAWPVYDSLPLRNNCAWAGMAEVLDAVGRVGIAHQRSPGMPRVVGNAHPTGVRS